MTVLITAPRQEGRRHAGQLIVAAALVLLCTPRLFAAAVALGLLASPHLLVPDMVVLVPAFIWIYPEMLRPGLGIHRPSTAEVALWAAWLWIGVATLLGAGNGGVGFPGRLLPWGLILFAVVAITAPVGPRGGDHVAALG